jgi:hypothetical protein
MGACTYVYVCARARAKNHLHKTWIPYLRTGTGNMILINNNLFCKFVDACTGNNASTHYCIRNFYMSKINDLWYLVELYK